MKDIRNFSIIAHIDHGKSTLADRFIQTCGGLSSREMEAQVLDSMDLERERGITIKAQSVALSYHDSRRDTYRLNLIDTPGHVDFSYEVSRSLAACEGALLVVDAVQGVEAQSVANCYTAIDHGLEIVPVLNKMDLASADPDRVIREIEDIIGIPAEDALRVSAKTGQGIRSLLDTLVARIPSPSGDPDHSLEALVIDSWFDAYLGVVSLVRVVNGVLRSGQRIRVMSTGRDHGVDHVGVFTPKRQRLNKLRTGQVGYVVAGIKDINGAPVGDTLTETTRPTARALPGFKEVKPQVYAGMFPAETTHFEAFREALAKLRLNDAALQFEPETSEALGLGFRCGFLGMLHMDIVRERLEREYNLNLITTAPSVVYEVERLTGEVIHIDNPARLPPRQEIATLSEPVVRADILVPERFLGNVISLCVEKRGRQKRLSFLGDQVSLTYELPMGEVVLDFFDRLKSVSWGFASLDYHFSHYEAADLVKLDVLINGDRVDALSVIVHREESQSHGRSLVKTIRALIPRQMFEVAIQAAIGSQIVARETVKALRKNVTAKCYGGDVTRKRKLLEKQKAGKKRMKQLGRVEIPQEAFLAVVQTGARR